MIQEHIKWGKEYPLIVNTLDKVLPSPMKGLNDQYTTSILTENIHYTVDYENKTVKIHTPWTYGHLEIKYHPLWTNNIKPSNLPLRLDYMEETFQIKENNTIKLKVTPLDPIRSLEYYDEQEDSWIQLKENEDFTLNYPQNSLQILKPN